MMRLLYSLCFSCLILFNINIITMAEGGHSTISVDKNYFYAVRADGVLYRFEYQDSSQINPNKIKIMDKVTDVSKNYAITEDNTLWTWGDDCIPVPIAEGVSSVSCSTGELQHVLFVKKDGSLWGRGYDEFSKLSSGGTVSSLANGKNIGNVDYYEKPVKLMDNVKVAKTGVNHSIVLKNDGSIWCFGDNAYNQLGVSSSDMPIKKACNILNDGEMVFASGAESFAIKDNKLYHWGCIDMNVISDNIESLCINKPTQYTSDIKYAMNIPGYNLLIKNGKSLWIYGDSEEIDVLTVARMPLNSRHINIPVKLMDNVDSISGLDCNETYYEHIAGNNIIILTNNGELKLFDFNEHYNEKNGESIYTTKRVSNNIRLSTVNPQYTDFDDLINSSKNVKNAVNALLRARIISGVTDTEFMPDKEISRAETAALMLRMTGKENETGHTNFVDVPQNSWYYNIAGASQKYNIFDGYEDNTFRGEETVSELQLVALAARTFRNEGTAPDVDEKAVPDLSGIPDWAKIDVEYAYQYGIVTADELKTLSDKGMSRGDAAVILYRLYQVI